jgi:hypothetical protein
VPSASSNKLDLKTSPMANFLEVEQKICHVRHVNGVQNYTHTSPDASFQAIEPLHSYLAPWSNVCVVENNELSLP